MKYKIGDKFLVEITEINDSCYPYTLNDIGVITTEETLDKLRRPDDMTAEDTWKIAKNIVCPAAFGGFSADDANDIFGTASTYDIMQRFTPQQAKAKIKAWEAEKEIKVGDEVAIGGAKGVVVRTEGENPYAYILWKDGSCGKKTLEGAKKTGRHIDIQGVLEQIGGAE